MGQITQVTPAHATVLLLTDPDHAVPVVVASSGVRLIAYGRGRSDQLELADIPLNSGVKVGDVVVTSGLGGRFPAGFPVGTITALRPDDSHAFLVGDVRPAAQLDRGRDVLLLRSAPPLRLPSPATRPATAPVDPASVPVSPAVNGVTPATGAAANAAGAATPGAAGTAPATASPAGEAANPPRANAAPGPQTSPPSANQATPATE